MRRPSPTDIVKAVAAWEWTATPAGMGYMRSKGAYGDENSSPVAISTEAILELPEFQTWFETVFIPRLEKRGAIYRTSEGFLVFSDVKGRVN